MKTLIHDMIGENCITIDDLNRLLAFHGLNSNGQAVMKRVIENSKQYYHDPELRKNLDDIFLEQSREQQWQ